MQPDTTTTSTSKRASRIAPPPSADDPLVTAAEAAAYRRQGLSTFWRDVKAGTVPAPIRITPKAPRWRRSWLVPQGAA